MNPAQSDLAPIASMVSEGLYWAFLATLILNLMQRRYHKQAERKRFATLYIALALFALFVSAQLAVINEWGDWVLIPALLVIVGVMAYYRERTFPFRLRSPRDGRRLTWNEVLFDDEHGDGDDGGAGNQTAD